MFATVLIGLREGLETGIVVMILIAFLVKSDRRDALKWVWTGVLAALALVVAVFFVTQFGTSQLSTIAQELIGGITSLLAVVIVTGMALWMRKAARSMSGHLRESLTGALVIGPVAVVAMSFLAVGREGVETAFLLLAYVDNARSSNAAPLVGLVIGVLVAVVITVGMYFGTVRINLATFFTYTGVLLILVAAGILAYGLHDLQEANVLPGLSAKAFDISRTFDPGSWYGTVLQGIFNFRPDPTILQVIGWTAYLVIVLPVFLRPAAPTPSTAAAAPTPTPTPTPNPTPAPAPTATQAAEKSAS